MPHIVGEERKKEFSTKEPPMSLRENVLVMKGTYNMLIEHPWGVDIHSTITDTEDLLSTGHCARHHT